MPLQEKLHSCFHTMAGLSQGWGKSITVIIMTMEANSTATSAILKPSAAAAYQGSP